MDDAIGAAIRCFKENRADFGDPRVSPEKYNLYNGLGNLAEGIAALQAQVLALAQEVALLKRELGQR